MANGDFNRQEQLEQFIQDANVVIQLHSRKGIGIVPLYCLLTNDIVDLAKMQAEFSPRIGELVKEIKKEQKGGI
jgi:hypothetical protein